MQTLIPSRLYKGDTIGIISPSSTLYARKEKFEKAIEIFAQKFDVQIKLSPHVMGRHLYSSGTTKERLDDFHQMIADPEIKAIIFSIGGDSAIDLIARLDYALIKKHPKIIAGISDASTLLNPIFAKTGLFTFHGLEFTDFGLEPMTYETEQIKKTFFAGETNSFHANPSWHDFDNLPTSYAGWQTIKKGKTTGRIVGGNFACFSSLLGTDYAPSLTGNLLVLESFMWSKGKLHQELMALKLQGYFEQISGLIIGYCIGSDTPGKLGDEQSMKDLLLEITEGYTFPIIQIGEIGHNVDNLMLPIGAKATIDATHLTFSIDEEVVR